MNRQRRSLLKGMVAGSVGSGLLGVTGLALADRAVHSADSVPTLVLTSNAQAEAAFVSGVRAAMPGAQLELQRSDLSSTFLGALDQRLRAGQQGRVVGLVDDASAAIMVQLARSAGARVHWVGQHSVGASMPRHQALGSRDSRACTLSFGEQLNRCGSGYTLREMQPQSDRAPLLLSSARAAQDGWAASLGYALTAQAAGQGVNVAQASSLPLQGHYVSFLIEV